MMVRTQVTLENDTHRRAKRRAADLGVSFAEYVRQTLDRDLGEQPKTDISAIVGIGNSGGSNIAKHKDQYIGEAFWQDHLRATGKSDPDR